MIARTAEPSRNRSEAPSAAERAYQYVNARLGWEYLAGARLPVDVIALAVRTSRQPVRDAVQRLAAERLVVVVAKVGCIVVKPERQEIEDLARLVAIADATFVPTAARRATPSDLASLTRLVALAERSVAIEWRGIDEQVAARFVLRDFFDEIYRIGATRAVAETVASMRCRVQALTRLRFFDLRRGVAPEIARAEARLVAQTAARSLRALLAEFADGDPESLARAAYARALSVVARADGFASEPLYGLVPLANAR